MPVRAVATILLTAALAAPAVPAQAAPGDTDIRWSVQPSTAKGPDGRDYFVRRAAPGEQLTDHVGVTNLTKAPLTFTVYGTDAFTTADGAFGLLPAAQTATDVGSWIKLAQRTYTVHANTRLDIPFTLAVPTNATPGDHAGGIIASIATAQTTGTGQKMLVDRRIAARVYLTVAGATAPTLSIDTVRLEYTQSPNPTTGGAMTVSYRVTNTGNLRLSGAGSVRVTGPFGWELARTGAMSIPELLPGGSLTVTEKIVGVQPTVRLAAQVSVEPATFERKLPAVTRTTGVWAWPWALVAAIALALLYLAFRLIRRRITQVREQRSAAAAKALSPAVDAGTIA